MWLYAIDIGEAIFLVELWATAGDSRTVGIALIFTLIYLWDRNLIPLDV
jgi:hypothetical protein